MRVRLGQRGLPRRCVTVMFCAWALQSGLLIGFALATGLWEFAVISLLSGGLSAIGNVVWGPLTNTLVPDALRGRVSSCDWLVSIGVSPVSFALTGPLASALGALATLLVAGGAGAGRHAGAPVRARVVPPRATAGRRGA